MNSTQRKQLDQTMIAAIKKYLTATTPLVVLTTTYSQTTLEAVFQDDIDAAGEAEAARAAWLVASKASSAKALEVSKVRRALQAQALSTYGDSDDVRSDWGMPPVRTASLTAAAKAEAALKAAATRKARGTMGKKQKAKITGEVPATPPVSVALPAVAATK